jgi:hypothetical protein
VRKTPFAAIIPILFPALLAGQMQEDSLGLKGYVPKPLLLFRYSNFGTISAYFWLCSSAVSKKSSKNKKFRKDMSASVTVFMPEQSVA